MAWLGIISVALIAEFATIVLLGRAVTDRYETEELEVLSSPRQSSAPVIVRSADRYRSRAMTSGRVG